MYLGRYVVIHAGRSSLVHMYVRYRLNAIGSLLSCKSRRVYVWIKLLRLRSYTPAFFKVLHQIVIRLSSGFTAVPQNTISLRCYGVVDELGIIARTSLA